jgi:DNA-binding XRE family transcriptional regulator
MTMNKSNLRLAVLQQIAFYISNRDVDACYYGNRKQFETRHQEILEWIRKELEDATNDPKLIHPLRNYRVVHGLTCADLAKKLGIAEPTLRSFENGNRTVSAELAVEIEKLIGIKRAIFRSDIFDRAT